MSPPPKSAKIAPDALDHLKTELVEGWLALSERDQVGIVRDTKWCTSASRLHRALLHLSSLQNDRKVDPIEKSSELAYGISLEELTLVLFALHVAAAEQDKQKDYPNTRPEEVSRLGGIAAALRKLYDRLTALRSADFPR